MKSYVSPRSECILVMYFLSFSFSKGMLLQMLVSRKYIYTIQCYCNSQSKNDHNESQDITSQGRGTDGGRPCRKLCETLNWTRCHSTCPSVQWGCAPSPRTTRSARWWEEGSCVCSINHQSMMDPPHQTVVPSSNFQNPYNLVGMIHLAPNTTRRVSKNSSLVKVYADDHKGRGKKKVNFFRK